MSNLNAMLTYQQNVKTSVQILNLIPTGCLILMQMLTNLQNVQR